MQTINGVQTRLLGACDVTVVVENNDPTKINDQTKIFGVKTLD